jgi:hypothetical protein
MANRSSARLPRTTMFEPERELQFASKSSAKNSRNALEFFILLNEVPLHFDSYQSLPAQGSPIKKYSSTVGLESAEGSVMRWLFRPKI